MKVIFYKAEQGNWTDKLIAWWTSPFKHKLNGDWLKSYSHVELLFSDGMMFSASQYENATRFTRRNPQSIAWVEVELDISWYEETLVRKFCQKHSGLKYDYVGVAGFVFGNPDESSKWFCSEICMVSLQSIGMFLDKDASKVSPNGMYRIITK